MYKYSYIIIQSREIRIEEPTALFDSQQPLHSLLFSILLSELVQRAVVPTKWSKQHFFSFLLHTTVKERLYEDMGPGLRRRKSSYLTKSTRKHTFDKGITYKDVLSSIFRYQNFS